MIELTTLGSVTCFAIIIAMGVIVFKAFSYPLTSFFNAINPLYYRRRIMSLFEMLEDLRLDNYQLTQKLENLNEELKKIKSKAKK